MKERIGFFTKPYPRVRSHRALIDETVAHGLQVVEAFNDSEFAKPDIDAAKRLRDYADARGVRFSCLSCFANLTGDRAAEAVRRLQDYAKVAEILGAPYLHHTVIPEHDFPERVLPHREKLLQQSTEGARAVFDYAAEHGVTAVYEDQGYIVNGVQGFGEFLERVDRPAGVVADFGNICQSGETILDFLQAFRDRVVHVHLKDYVLLPVTDPMQPLKTLNGQRFELTDFGCGAVPFRKGIELLKEIGYSGCYSLEFSAGSDSSPTIRHAIDVIENWIS